MHDGEPSYSASPPHSIGVTAIAQPIGPNYRGCMLDGAVSNSVTVTASGVVSSTGTQGPKCAV